MSERRLFMSLCNCKSWFRDISNKERRRLAGGVLVLLLVDVIWVASSELTDYIFHDEGFDKPFFSTYFKTSAFIVYLLGFSFYQPWKQQCCGREDQTYMQAYHGTSQPSPDGTDQDEWTIIGDSNFEPMTDDDISSHNSLIGESELPASDMERHVHFNSVREVRRLPDTPSGEGSVEKLPLIKVAKISALFCLLWFAGNLFYQEAISKTSPAAVNILSSTSGLFTLILASIFPGSAADKFTLTKLIAVVISITGIVMVTMSDAEAKTGDSVSLGDLYALLGALCYASYMVFLRKSVSSEDQMDITMFFGFVGLFNLLLLWPGFFLLHFLKVETFHWPSTPSVWGYLCLNAVVGTVLSDWLFLWGCFLTSSLTATVALGLVIPMTMMVDIFVRQVKFSWMFYVGTIPVFASFFFVSVLSHYSEWDPVLSGLRKCCGILTSSPRTDDQSHIRTSYRDRGQQDEEERLIQADSSEGVGIQ